jgi:glyceraldehyde-3-phosphate dehydrogenase (NADP+)
VILKPSELAPLSALRLLDTLVVNGLPPEVVTIAVGGAELGEVLVAARDVRMVSFTGGFRTGERITRAAGLKKLAMELGGNAPVIVMPDADISDAVARCAAGAFSAAGQNCVRSQRILVHRSVLDRFRFQFIQATRQLRVGDPADHTTDVGPMISEGHARRAEELVDRTMAAGTRLLHGNGRSDTLYQPTILENVAGAENLVRAGHGRLTATANLVCVDVFNMARIAAGHCARMTCRAVSIGLPRRGQHTRPAAATPDD